MNETDLPRHEELAALRVLEEIERDARTSQREISRRLGVSVGLVNLIIGRLIRKAWVKVTTIPGRRLVYALTPKGMLEKMRKTRDWVRLSLKYAFEMKRLIADGLRGTGRSRPSVSVYGSPELAPLVEEATRGMRGRFLGHFGQNAAAPGGTQVIVAFRHPSRGARAAWARAGIQVVDLN